jgi:AAA15 family ATPase/GTPase
MSGRFEPLVYKISRHFAENMQKLSKYKIYIGEKPLLLRFSVKNFRSFEKEETLNLCAGKGAELRESNTFEFYKELLVRSAVIYGPNASGKSNLIKAIYFLQQFVLLSSTSYQEKQKIPLRPFRLDEKSHNEPSEFTIDFVCEGVRFTYQVALTEDQVIREELCAYPKNYRQIWFTRSWNSSSSSYDWYQGPSFKGEHKVWEQVTRSNALYLSTAVQFNSEQLKPLFLWFRDQLVVLLKNSPTQEIHFNPDLTFQFLKDPQTASWIQKFMECADVGIEGFQLIEEESSPITRVAVRTHHRMLNSNLNVVFDLYQDESDGTQILFSKAGGWLKALQEGLVLFVDELDLHLHPNIVRFLVELFHSPKTNLKNAQLVFTTHDTSLLDTDLFRRDQVWFVQKDDNKGSRLYSLLDFKPRKGEAIGKGYLQGRYGALPFMGKFRFT